MTGRSMVRAMPFVLLVLAGSVPATAAVYEVGEDGSVERLDVPAAAAPRAAPQQRRYGGGTTARSQAYRPYVAEAATRYEVSPQLIDAIAHTESRYNQAAVSRAGAAGIMQLMPGTARDLGVDSRDAQANIRGGTAYLRMLLNRFDGDVVRTIAAYNAGPAAVTRVGGVPRTRETVNYVAVVLDRLADAAK